MSSTATTQNASVKLQQEVCPNCNQEASKLKRCARCNFARYCSKECQKSKWPQHKKVCHSLKNEADLWKKFHTHREAVNVYWKSFNRGNVFPLLERFFNSQVGNKLALDLGCGTGVSSKYLLDRGWKVIAVDYFAEQTNHVISIFRQHRPHYLETGLFTKIESDVHEYIFPENVDLILAADLFPYLDPCRVGNLCEKIYRSLKPGGHFLGSFFDRTSHLSKTVNPWTLDHAWTLESTETVKTLLTEASFHLEYFGHRVKPGRKCAVIDFSAKKL